MTEAKEPENLESLICNEWHGENLPAPKVGGFIMSITGASQSGKTTFLLNILPFYHGVYNEIFLFYPSIGYEDDPYEAYEFTEKWRNLDEDTLDYLKEHCGEKFRANRHYRALVILDDQLSNPYFSRYNQEMGYIPCEARHDGMSFIILSQTVTGIPKIIRDNTHCNIIFSYASYMIFTEDEKLGRAFVKEHDAKKDALDILLKRPYMCIIISVQDRLKYMLIQN